MNRASLERPAFRGQSGGGDVLLLGLGNDLLSDDAVGLQVAREIGGQLSGVEGIEVRESTEMGLSLLDHIEGFEALVLVDAVQTGREPPGFLHEFGIGDLERLPVVSPHFLGVAEVLALGRRLGLSVPRRLRIFAVEVSDPLTVGLRLTTPVEKALPAIAARVLAAARELRRPAPRHPVSG